jgi:hypothetical protein
MRYHFIDHYSDADYDSHNAQKELFELDSDIDQHITDADYPPVPESDSNCVYWYTDSCQCHACKYVKRVQGSTK